MTSGARWRIGFKPFLYDDSVPSVRLRALLPMEALRGVGISATMVPPDGSGEYDCVVFQKSYEDHDLALAQRLAASGTALVFDLCDNHFYEEDGDPVLAERAARLRRMIEQVDAVTVSVPQLGELVAPKRTFVVDDALEVLTIGRFSRAALATGRAMRRRDTRVRLVWFGHHGDVRPPAGMVHLATIVPDLEALDQALPLRLTVISNSRSDFDTYVDGAAFPTRYVHWSSRSFARTFCANDVCVLPIEPNAATVYKTNNRVRTSLLLGLPIVTSEIPAYREFAEWIRFGNWSENITVYATDPQLARAHVEGARAHIAATYTTEHLVEQWSGVFRAVMERGAAR